MTSEQARGWLRLCGSMLSAQLNAAQANQELGQEVLYAWDRLDFLFRISQALSRTTDPRLLVVELANLARDAFHTAGAFILQRRASGMYHHCLGSERKLENAVTLMTRISAAEGPLLLNRTEECADLLQPGLAVQSFLGIALNTQVGPSTAIGVFNRLGGTFNAGDWAARPPASVSTSTPI